LDTKRSTQKGNSIFSLFILGICLFFLIGAVLLLQNTANATQITLAWDESNGAAGYKIYSGTTSNSYSWIIDVGNATSYTTTELTDGYTYYFAATAYDITGLESDYSGEVSYTPGPTLCSYSISPSSAYSDPKRPPIMIESGHPI
jgi:hypothetical protein